LKSLLKRRVILPDDGSVPYTEGWYYLTNNVGAVWGIIPTEFDDEPHWRSRRYTALAYPEAFDGSISSESDEITIAGQHGSVMETQRYLYIGCTGKFSGVRFTFGRTNDTQGAALAVQYFTDRGWLYLQGANDGCAVSGRPMAKDGEYTFAPPDDWIKGSGVQFSGFTEIYWLRFTLFDNGDTVNVKFTLKEVEVYGTPEVDKLRWCSGLDHWTDIMRHLVRDQCISGTIAAGREIAYLSCEDDTHEGLDEDGHQLNLCYRYDNLATVLEEISGLGADFDIVETAPGHYQFRVYYGQTGNDFTEDNEYNNTPVTFSLENGNIDEPDYSNDRVSEVTVCYGVGKMANGVRPIYRRVSLYDAQDASVWNAIEATSDSTSQDSEAAVIATADSYLMDNTQKIEVTFKAKPTPNCLYGVHWDLGDMVGFYFNKHYYKMRVVQVDVTVDDNGEAIVPTLIQLPDISELYWTDEEV